MQKLVQLAIGSAVMFGAAPYLYGTPFNHWMIYLPLFVGAMYATALVQAHWPLPMRGRATTVPGASISGSDRMPSR